MATPEYAVFKDRDFEGKCHTASAPKGAEEVSRTQWGCEESGKWLSFLTQGLGGLSPTGAVRAGNTRVRSDDTKPPLSSPAKEDTGPDGSQGSLLADSESPALKTE